MYVLFTIFGPSNMTFLEAGPSLLGHRVLYNIQMNRNMLASYINHSSLLVQCLYITCMVKGVHPARCVVQELGILHKHKEHNHTSIIHWCKQGIYSNSSCLSYNEPQLFGTCP